MRRFKFILSVFIIVALQLIAAVKYDDSLCNEQIFGLIEAVSDKELWPLKLLDAWGKINSGYLVGNVITIGSYDECLNFTHVTDSSGTIEGQHCFIDFSGSKNDSSTNSSSSSEQKPGFKISTGICVPATCSPEKVLELLNSKLPAGLNAAKAICATRDPIPLDNVDITAISMLSVAVMLVIVSTLYDLHVRQDETRKPNKLLTAFSAYTNGKAIFEVKRGESPRSIACLEGLRSISMMFVILSHRNIQQLMTPTTNILEYAESFKKYSTVFLLWEPLCVDTFLVLGGFLSAMVLFYAFSNKSFNAFQSVVKRYLRYTPTLVATTICFLSASRHIHSIVGRGATERDICDRYWWSLLLHIQNYYNPNDVCGGSSWYLSVDFQLFLITPLLVYPAIKHGWKYLSVLAMSAVATSLYILNVCLENEIRFGSMSKQKFAETVYATHARYPAWIIGILLAYLVFRMKDKTFKLNQKLINLIWLVALAAMSAVIALHYPLYQEEYNPYLMFHAAYTAFFRSVWSLGVAWIIFACYKLQSGGVIRWFLSWPEWQPIGRLSLSMYLCNDSYLILTLSHAKEAITLRMWTTITAWLGDILIVMALATFFCLAFELPIMSITALIFSKPKKKKEEEEEKIDLSKEAVEGLENPAFVSVEESERL